MANRSLLLKDIKKFNDNMQHATNYIDIDYDVKSPPDNPWTTRTRMLNPKDNYAILNGYRMWLQSKRYDYVRAPLFGGITENNFNDRCTFGPENEELVRDIIIEESAQKWPDITIIECRVKAIMQFREWRIHIVAQDKHTKLVIADGEIAVKADDMNNYMNQAN